MTYKKPLRLQTGNPNSRKWQEIPLRLGALMLGLTALVGCGKGMNAAPVAMSATNSTTSFAFVANSGSGTITAFAISTSGSLSSVSGSPFTAGAGAEFMPLIRSTTSSLQAMRIPTIYPLFR